MTTPAPDNRATPEGICTNWIRCSERMPAEHMTVLLWDSASGYPAIGWMPYWNTGQPTGRWAYAVDAYEQDGFNPTHWQPLPAAPDKTEVQ